MRWARFIAIHATGGQREDYVQAVLTTEAMRRVVMVECPSDALETWHAVAQRWAPRTPGIRIVASGDGVHPVRGSVQ